MWVWARLPRTDLVDTVRDAVRDGGGSVLVTLVIPRGQLLLTDYLEWHTVLNGQPSPPLECPQCGTRHCNNPVCHDGWFDRWSEDWDEQARRAGVDLGRPWWTWPEPAQTQLLASWENVFSPPRRRPLQGCVEFIRAGWVRAAVTPTT